MKKIVFGAFLAISASSFATLITFDDGAVSEGSLLANQYSALGISFVAGSNGHSVPNPSATTQGFATNSDMHITSTDIGGGVSAPISGKMLHTFGGWLSENGDPLFTMVFTSPISSLGLDAGGIFNSASTALYAFNAGGTLIGTTAAVGTGTKHLSLASLANATEVVMTVGDFGDWVGVDNIEFTVNTVPEPFTMVTLGLGVAALARKRAKKA